MILEGNARGHGAELAYHLLNERDNDHVRLHNLEGFVSDDLRGAFLESEAISLGTQCQKYLFSLSLNPPTEAQVPIEAFEEVIARIEIKLGLKGQPRAVVFHEKLGRSHAHVVWSRIDVATMKAIQLPHFKRKLMAISRELYLEHGWDLPAGFLDHEARDPNRYSREEAGQAKRTKSDSAALKAMFRACWERSDSRAGFAAALLDQGYVLARGSRRGFVAVDRRARFGPSRVGVAFGQKTYANGSDRKISFGLSRRLPRCLRLNRATRVPSQKPRPMLKTTNKNMLRTD